MAVALCKKINCVARVLAYALLEWILIALLLTNSVFSYLISSIDPTPRRTRTPSSSPSATKRFLQSGEGRGSQ